MHYLVALASSMICLQAYANFTSVVRVAEIDSGDSLEEDILIYFSSGIVGKIAPSQFEKLQKLHKAKEDSAWIEITLNRDREVVRLDDVSGPHQREILEEIELDKGEYVPSTLGSLGWAKKYFSEMRGGWTKDSQCYNRAHVWAHDWKKNRNFFSSKVFIFFTRKYIRRENFEWWFHVAPYVNVKESGRVVERVMDRRYLSGPTLIKDWTDFFLKDDAVCPQIDTYSQYINYPETGSCFIMKASMYYYQPIDFENDELFGSKRPVWVDWEIKNAYSQAFGVNI